MMRNVIGWTGAVEDCGGHCAHKSFFTLSNFVRSGKFNPQKAIYEMTSKQYVFTVYFNYNFKENDGKSIRSRDWAEEKRKQSLVYLTRLFEHKARFACIAKDSGLNHLSLKGYVNLNSPCTVPHAKKLIGGRFSSCKPSYFGDMVSLCRLLHIDRDLTVIGRLPKVGGNSTRKMKSFATNPKFVKKILLQSIIDKEVSTTEKKIE